MKITSTEFQQNVGRYQDAAQHAPVVITKNARAHTVLMSAAFFEMVMKGRIARPIEDLDDGTLAAIARSSVTDEDAVLDNVAMNKLHATRRSFATAELPKDLVAAIAGSHVDARPAHLDGILEQK